MANYCIVKDDDLGWYKLYRTDGDFVPPGEVFWQGNSLKTGYDMMKSINKRHRKIVLYHLAKSLSDTGREIFRIFKQAPQSPWTTVKIHKEFDAAKNHMKTLIGARNAVEERDFNRKMSLLRRVNVESKRIPRLSATDWKYLEWMKETGRLTDEQKETMNWYKRQEAIDTPVQQTDAEQPISA